MRLGKEFCKHEGVPTPAVHDSLSNQIKDAEFLPGGCTFATWGLEGVDDQDVVLPVHRVW